MKNFYEVVGIEKMRNNVTREEIELSTKIFLNITDYEYKVFLDKRDSENSKSRSLVTTYMMPNEVDSNFFIF